ncbi:MAG: hypothetical protein HC901_01230 [Bdellovibrionaceae bacterium]|nr:hypothetical protein [Pseudobdellovibrionaceae bacterium]
MTIVLGLNYKKVQADHFHLPGLDKLLQYEVVSGNGNSDFSFFDKPVINPLPGVNNLHEFGRWAFQEFTSAFDLDEDFEKLVASLVKEAV